MNVIQMPGNVLCEGCGFAMGIQQLGHGDPDTASILVVCANPKCLREGKVLKFPLTRVDCTPAIAGSDKAQSTLIVPQSH